MTEEEKIKKSIKLSLLHSIKTIAQGEDDAVNIYLCDIDEPATFEAYKKELEEIKGFGALEDYTLETLKKGLPNISKPSDLEVESDPTCMANYYEQLQRYKDSVGELYNSLKINRAEINVEIIEGLINDSLSTSTKIAVKDFKIFESNKNILIHQYNERDQAYFVADYLFNKNHGEWVSWDEIIIEKFGDEYTEAEAIQPKHKKSIADSVRNINQYAKEKIGHEIIGKDGKDSYISLF